MFNRSPYTPDRVPLLARVTPACVYAVTRIALGAWIFIAPDQFGGKWMASSQDPVLTGSMIRANGGTDMAVGIGTLFANNPRWWLWLCAACDFLDAFAVFLARSRFSGQELWSGLIGATSYGLIAVAIAEFGAHRQRQARRP